MIKGFPFFPSVRVLLSLLLYWERVGSLYQDEFEIVVPRKVHSDGKFLSHQIPHHFKRSFYNDKKETVETPENGLHYRLRIGNEEHHLELYPNYRLLSPGSVHEVHKRSTSNFQPNAGNLLDDSKIRRIRDPQCHYIGRVRNHLENSALSTCYGLAGYIRTKRGWYNIEPVQGHDFTKEAEHPHVLYKRKPDDSGEEALCNVIDNMGKTFAKRALTNRKRPSSKNEAKSRYTLELLLVLDKTLLDYRRDFDVENYALTLLNMAAVLFHDASLGIPIELVIVRIIKLEVEEKQMNLSRNKDAEQTLKGFQEWQRTMNPGEDSHPNHHDCALLITKTDICLTSKVCGMTGISTIAGACDPLKGAAILVDVGLQTGYHIAHHIGHTLGMSHDVEKENGCRGVVYHGNGYPEMTIMHPGSIYVAKKWSKCSRSYLESYIESGLGFCLEDLPQDHRFPSTELLPGVMYNADDQCRLQYRSDAHQCDLGITCESLKCAIPGKGCVSARKPPAEGTPCGEKRWCYEMKCLMEGERPGAVDGGWGGWSSWSPCSRSCGSGIASSSRRCNNPPPSNGGSYCRGNRKRHKICAAEPCEAGTLSFRDVQCADFNDWTFPEDGRIHKWKAYNLRENLKDSENPCALYCVSETKIVAALRPKVIDGTTCYRGIRDICIAGSCREIPCDLDMESNAVEDVCGVCRGDSTSCRLKEGMITLRGDSHPKKILDVPSGSKNIRVEETQPTKSEIIVRRKDSKSVLIEGNRLGMFDVPGSKAWLGMIRPKQEALNIPGPVSKDLIILVSPKENVTLKYSLGLKEKKPRKAVFSWDFVDWEKCNANCGPGEQISKPRCVEKVGGLVDDKFCKNTRKPDTKVRPCNHSPCLPRWMVGSWAGCKSCVAGCKSCGAGCERTRAVKCVRPVGRAVQDIDIIADSSCQGPKPKERESCATRTKRDDVYPSEKMEDAKLIETHDQIIKSGNPAKRESATKKWRDNVAIKPAESGSPASPCKENKSIQSTSVPATLEKVALCDGRYNDLVTSEPEKGLKNPGYKVGYVSRLRSEINLNGDRTKVGKRSKINGDKDTGDREIRKGEVVIDKDDIRNLTLTVILERDEDNNVLNFPKDFKPQPSKNDTEFTLFGMDAVKYIQKIQEGKRMGIKSNLLR